MFSIKKNDLFVEITQYHKSSLGIEKNPDRNRDLILESSMRSKKNIIDYVINNPWSHFITITLNKKLIDRTDYENAIKKITSYFNHWRYENENDFRYILIPELHKRSEKNGKKAIHFHGFVYTKNMSLIFKCNRDLAFVYSNPDMTKKFGMNEFIVIYNGPEFVAYYVSKYVSKSIDDIKISYRRYFSSKGLKKSIIKSYDYINGFDELGLFPTFVNKFCNKWKMSVAEFEQIESNLEFLNLEV